MSKTLCLQISGSLTKGNAPLVKLSAPLIKLSAPLTILSAPLINLSRSTFTMEFQTSGSSLTHHKQNSVLTNQWLTYKRKCPTCKIECPAHKIECPTHKIECPTHKIECPAHNIECPAHEFEWLNLHHGVPNFRIIIDSPRARLCAYKSVLTYKWKCPTCKIECPTHKIECPAHKIECPTHNIECPAHEFESLNLHHGVPNLRIIIDSPRARLCAYKSVAHLQKEMPHL